MKTMLRLSLGTLMLVGTLAATVYPTTKVMLTGDGSDPVPMCYPLDPKCKPPMDPLPPLPPIPTVR
jgi:hypothetical protein